MRHAACGCLLLAAAIGIARAQDADDAALRLADQTAEAADPGKPERRLSVEAAGAWAAPRGGGQREQGQRLSLDLAWERALAPGWRFSLADRLDLLGPDRLPGERSSVNTLKELFLTGRLGRERIVDIGRVNLRLGVAMGYNPTDYFRELAVRQVVSVDPASLRENRQGTVMLRGQQLWQGGSTSLLYSPKLGSGPNPGKHAIDVGATNHRHRWLLSLSQTLATDLQPQLLLYEPGEPHSSLQLGLNLTHLLSPACVAHAEWSGGRGPDLLARSRGQPGEAAAFHSQLAAGLTCTTARKLSLTAEYERNGAALDDAGWRALRRGPLAAELAYRQVATERQDPPTRHNLFLRAAWQDALWPRLDLSAMLRANAADDSRQLWAEARYRLDSTDLALQWQGHHGSRRSEFGALPQRQLWQLLVKHWF